MNLLHRFGDLRSPVSIVLLSQFSFSFPSCSAIIVVVGGGGGGGAGIGGGVPVVNDSCLGDCSLCRRYVPRCEAGQCRE